MRMGRLESSENSQVGTALTFLLIGLGAGALVGMLFAPKTGKQLRRDLKRGYEDAMDSAEEWAGEARERVRDASERLRDVAGRSANMAADIADGVRERVEPLRRAINRS